MEQPPLGSGVSKSPSFSLETASGTRQQHQPDSFFTRVFGHHSQESSRAGSPLLSSPKPTQTLSSTTGTRASSRHMRNSSTGTLPSPDQISTPIVIPSASYTLPGMQRRRSFDNTPQPSSSNPLNRDHLSVSFKDEATGAMSDSSRCKNSTPVPFPRGGRHIGETNIPQQFYTTSPQKPLSRSNSGEPQKQDQDQPVAPKDKKRHHLFGRFTKKKSRNELHSTNHSTSYSPSSHSPSISSQASSTPSTASSISTNNPRKRSNDNDIYSHRGLSTHPLELAPMEDPLRFMQRGPITNLYSSANGIMSTSTSSSSANERKRSAGQQPGKKQSKEREKSDGSIYYSGDRSKKDTKDIELDQNFTSMDGIVNPEYYQVQPTSVTPSTTTTTLCDQLIPDMSSNVESWAPPDSWAVQPPGIMVVVDATAASIADEDTHDSDEYTLVEQEKYDIKKKNYCIRIFRPDETFGTLQLPLHTTTAELMQKLAGKFFLPDMTKYNLVLRHHKLERVLGLTERPLQIQKTLLEQMGYTDDDKIEDVGREDNSYLLRFTFGPNISQTISQDEAEFGAHIDLQARNLSAIPIFLYKHATRIVSLDVSRNLLIEIPVDFVQMCKGLQQLRLTNNDYTSVPTSTRYIRSLKQLNISGNRLRDLHHARLHEIEGLRALRVYNNRLDSLPASFGSFKHMTTLFISNNSFTSFPDVICQITTLECLDISFNKINTFPDELGQLINLESLHAIANRISGPLPLCFTKLEKLQELDVRQNFITDLDVLCDLPKLELVSVDYNAISIANYDFLHLRRLKMYKNHLTQFSLTRKLEDSLIAQPALSSRLTELNLSNCKLSSLPDDVFIHTTLLEHLVLDSNTINRIPSSIGSLRKLVRFSVQNNNLDSLPPEIANLHELKILDAQKNNLKTLPKEIWLCPSLQILNCSSNLLESFPEPYSVPGVALHLPLTPQGEAVVSSVIATENVLQGQLGTNAGQGIVPMAKNDVTCNSLIHPLEGHGGNTNNNNNMDSDNGNKSNTAENNNNNGNNIDDRRLPPDTLPIKTLTSSNTSSSLSSTGTVSNNLPSPHAPPNFNPPSFFASPRNHPPPLSLSLRQLFLGDNRLTDDDIWSPLTLFLELRTLNLSFNDLFEIPPDGLCHQHLYELYLSGNQLTSLPADDIEKLSYLRVLAVNGNKLQTLPAEIGKLRKLLVLDVGNNLLKYNIANWPYDWNWNWNLGLKYLNLSGNKRLEIKKTPTDPANPNEKDLSDFSALTRLRMLGLMDITILGVSTPEEFHNRRVRTSPSEVNSMAYGIADWLGPSDHLATWDLVMPRFRNNDDESVFGLFDGRKNSKSGCKLTKYLNDNLTYHFYNELRKNKGDDTIVCAVRRMFLALQKELGSSVGEEKDSGASAVMCYIAGTKLYVANVGDALAVISRNNGQAFEITQKHIPLNPSEISRIRSAGGYVSNAGLLNGELNVSRSFGHFHLIPVVNANPYISTIDLTEDDEFVIMASRGLWDRMSYQTAVDIARTEKDDLMAAAQKLRDFAITYGADDNIMVMVIGVNDLFDKRDKRFRNLRGGNIGPGRGGVPDNGFLVDDSMGLVVGKNKRRGKEDGPGDSTLARLEREIPPPINQVALVFTDIKSSTQFWETQPENMRSAIKIHDAVMRRTLRSVGGYEVKTEGDAFMVCFQSITAALLWCFTAQLQLLEADWPAGILDSDEGREIEKDNVVIYKGLSVRMGIHWGMPVFERNPITNRMDYFGPVVNKASRICNAADGGQICVSSDVVAALRNFSGVLDTDSGIVTFDDSTTSSATTAVNGSFSMIRDMQQLKRLGFHVMELGERRLKGLETPEMLSLVYPKQLSARMELDKSEMMTQDAPLNAHTTPKSVEPASLVPSPRLEPDDVNNLDISSGFDGTISPCDDDVTTPHYDNHQSRQRQQQQKHHHKRTIDPALVSSLSNLAIRLERLTAGNVLIGNKAGSSISSKYTSAGHNGDPSHIVSTAPWGLGRLLDKHMMEDASDEELVLLMENCVARVENAVSSLYLQKMGRFASVLEKLGDAVELDPMHILRALQMYSEVAGLDSKPPPGDFRF
ncbi:hypothetical protein BC941DRAFT_464678 [Chlamydoabsidia padenii]|nr:hypothetical protein BC941DRAFT_464678 [Chlamydoabsidia padenii]